MSAAVYRYDVVIVHHGANAALHAIGQKCLKSVLLHSRYCRVLWIDNGSPVEYPTKLRELVSRPEVLSFWFPENVGFIEGANFGLAASTAPYVVLMNNDAQAVPQWLEKLSAPLVDRVGLSGPLTTNAESWQGRYRTGNRNPLVLNDGAMLAFFCVMIRRAVVDRIGFLNPAYGVGFGDDDEYCWRAQRAGYDLVLVRDLVIPHRHRTTFRALYPEDEIQRMQREALEHFARDARTQPE